MTENKNIRVEIAKRDRTCARCDTKILKGTSCFNFYSSMCTNCFVDVAIELLGPDNLSDDLVKEATIRKI